MLKQALFMYFVDCRIPHQLDTQSDERKTCDLCRRYMVMPSRWRKCARHKFCRRCIVQWATMIGNPEIGTFTGNIAEVTFNLGRSKAFPVVEEWQTDIEVDIILPERCPLYYKCKVQDTFEKPIEHLVTFQNPIKMDELREESRLSEPAQLKQERKGQKLNVNRVNSKYSKEAEDKNTKVVIKCQGGKHLVVESQDGSNAYVADDERNSKLKLPPMARLVSIFGNGRRWRVEGLLHGKMMEALRQAEPPLTLKFRGMVYN